MLSILAATSRLPCECRFQELCLATAITTTTVRYRGSITRVLAYFYKIKLKVSNIGPLIPFSKCYVGSKRKKKKKKEREREKI